MQYLCVYVYIGEETGRHDLIDKALKTMKREDVLECIQDQREENTLIIQTAVDELCNVLELSNRLREIDIRLIDIGHPLLKTGQEHRLLKPFGKLRNLHRVTTFNVPSNFTRIMEQTMKRKRN